MSIFTDLGIRYCNDFFHGAMLLYDDKPCMFERVSDDGEVTLLAFNKLRSKEIVAPEEHFPNFTSFSFPTLGYRYDEERNILMHVSRRFTAARRGLHSADLEIRIPDATYSVYRAMGKMAEAYTENTAWRIEQVMTPKYLSYGKGIERVLSGDIPFFAMSAHCAVAPAADLPDHLQILFRGNRVGTIEAATGNVAMNITNRFITEFWKKETSRE